MKETGPQDLIDLNQIDFEKLKERFERGRKRQQSRAQVYTTIKDVLDQSLPRSYTPELYNKKCQKIYQHIYDSYYGQGRSIYTKVS